MENINNTPAPVNAKDYLHTWNLNEDQKAVLDHCSFLYISHRNLVRYTLEVEKNYYFRRANTIWKIVWMNEALACFLHPTAIKGKLKFVLSLRKLGPHRICLVQRCRTQEDRLIY